MANHVFDLVRIATLRRQQAEGEYEAIKRKFSQIDSEIAKRRKQIDGLSGVAESDSQMLGTLQKYAESLVTQIKRLELRRERLRPQLALSRHRLKKAMHSEGQIQQF